MTAVTAGIFVAFINGRPQTVRDTAVYQPIRFDYTGGDASHKSGGAANSGLRASRKLLNRI